MSCKQKAEQIPVDLPEKLPPYQRLASIYDRVMSHVNYAHWAAYVEEIIGREGVPADRVLDIGCGTGQLVGQLARRGWPVAGCDASPEMIARARENFPHLLFFQDALPELSRVSPRQYGIMLCLYDTIHYLGDQNQLHQALQRIFQLLPGPGLFIFDAVSPLYCQTYFNPYLEREEFPEGIVFARKAWYDRKNRLQYNRLQIQTPDGVFEEEHRQQIYELGDLKALIESQGLFQIRHCYHDFSFREARANSGRVHFVLYRE